LIRDKKIAGILCETTKKDHKTVAIMGMGLNVDMDEEQLKKIDQKATSLKMELPHFVSVEQITDHLIEAFLEKSDLKDNEIMSAYQKALLHNKGDTLTFHAPDGIVKGTFDGLSDQGFLNIKLEDGTTKSFYTGDVT
jgi:BirA family biotin operon repressor/biotin-[acetyl-CoA-carboxylase] ligase